MPDEVIEVVGRAKRSWVVGSTIIPGGIFVAAVVILWPEMTGGSLGTFVAYALLELGFLYFVINSTERLGVSDHGLRLTRPPFPSRSIPTSDIEQIVKETAAQTLVHVRGRLGPINIRYSSLTNADDVRNALVRFADSAGIHIEESDTFRELRDDE